MTRYAVLLRGVNVGPHRAVGMADLRARLGAAGLARVRTHLRSGNVVLSSSDPPEDVARAVAAAVRDGFGIDVDVVVRTADELAGVVAEDALGGAEVDPSRRMVVFLPAAPDPAVLAAAAPGDPAPGAWLASGREIHVWCPDGVRDSRLLAALTAPRVAPGATARNWRTVSALAEIAREDG